MWQYFSRKKNKLIRGTLGLGLKRQFWYCIKYGDILKDQGMSKRADLVSLVRHKSWWYGYYVHASLTAPAAGLPAHFPDVFLLMFLPDCLNTNLYFHMFAVWPHGLGPAPTKAKTRWPREDNVSEKALTYVRSQCSLLRCLAVVSVQVGKCCLVTV